MGELIGYARCSKAAGEQDPSLQIEALKAAGCATIFVDHISGSTTKRPELDKLLAYVRPHDTVVVWKLDRWARGTRMLLESIGDLEERGVGFRSLTESIDTSTPVGALLLTVLGAVAQMELSNIRERSAAGVQAARNRGVRIGRPPKVTLTKIEAAREMRDGGMSTADIADALGISRRSVCRALQVSEQIAQAS